MYEVLVEAAGGGYGETCEEIGGCGGVCRVYVGERRFEERLSESQRWRRGLNIYVAFERGRGEHVNENAAKYNMRIGCRAWLATSRFHALSRRIHAKEVNSTDSTKVWRDTSVKIFD